MTGPSSRVAVALFVIAAAAVLAVPVAPAAAASTASEIAAKLRRSPVVVDPALADAVPDAQRRALVREIAAAPHPVWVALVPLTPGDRYGGDARRFLSVIHGRLGREGVYVTVDERLLTHAAFGVDMADPDRLSQASTVANFESGDFDETQISKVRRFVDAIGARDLGARYARTEERLARLRRESGRPPPPPARADDDADEGGGADWALYGAGGLVLLGGAGGLLLARRRRHARPAPADEPLIPARVFEHAHTAQAGDLREQIELRLLEFADRIDRGDAPSSEAAQERQQHALDAYAAARRVLGSGPRMVDLVGALVLVEDGTHALAAAEALEAGRRVPAPAQLCFFDPRHPGAARPVAWTSELTVPACAACRSTLRSGRAPDTLLDDGRPWFETDSLWARTGFGLFDPHLADRVARGELRGEV